MKNIFKENKDLKEENINLKIKVKELEHELLKTEDRYEEIMNRKCNYLVRKYEDKIKRKKAVIKICKTLEDTLNQEIIGRLQGYDITPDIDAYLKLLDYLKKGE